MVVVVQMLKFIFFCLKALKEFDDWIETWLIICLSSRENKTKVEDFVVNIYLTLRDMGMVIWLYFCFSRVHWIFYFWYRLSVMRERSSTPKISKAMVSLVIFLCYLFIKELNFTELLMILSVEAQYKNMGTPLRSLLLKKCMAFWIPCSKVNIT